MIPLPPRSARTDTRFPCTTLVRSRRTAERAARDLGFDGLFEHALGKAAFENLLGAGFLDAACIAGVLVIALVGHFLAGELHLFRIDDEIGRASCRERVCQYV